MDFSKLEEELREKLPSEQIDVNLEQGTASYYDFYGVTFRDNDAEQTYVNNHIMKIVSEKVGFAIKITREQDGNGHCTHYFERM